MRHLLLLALVTSCAAMNSSEVVKRRHEALAKQPGQQIPAPAVVVPPEEPPPINMPAPGYPAPTPTATPSQDGRVAAEVARALLQGVKVFAETRAQQAKPPTMRCRPDLGSATPGAVICEPVP